MHSLVQRLDGAWDKHLWQAPEVWLRSQCSKASDMFTFGLLMWYVVTEKEPYGGVVGFTQNTANCIAGGWRLPLPGFIPEAVADIIANCWLMKPSERISIGDVVEKLKLLQTEDYSSFKVMKFELDISR